MKKADATVSDPSVRHPHCDIAVIGGGASGMAAAWYARRCLFNMNAEHMNVALFERNQRLGKKLLMTGNGRCNLTNIECSIERFHGNDVPFAQKALSLFSPERIIAIMGELGVECTIEKDGKVFPATLHSASMLDALRLALDENNVMQYSETMIKSIVKTNGRFVLHSSDGKRFTASTVVIATGGACAPATGSDGNGYRLLSDFSHELTPPLPSIVQVRTETGFVKPLAGNKIHGTASLLINGVRIRSESGEILFTDYGLSGPPVLQLSGEISRTLYNATVQGESPSISIELDFLPEATPEEVTEMLRKRRAAFASRRLEEYLTGFFHRRLAYGLLKVAVKKPLSAITGDLTDEEICTLGDACKRLPVVVKGTMSLAHAQTTAGGILTCDFDPCTMQSKLCAGIFACGEILDIDGDCGGFNLHWAWASGFLAGESAAKTAMKSDG